MLTVIYTVVALAVAFFLTKNIKKEHGLPTAAAAVVALIVFAVAGWYGQLGSAILWGIFWGGLMAAKIDHRFADAAASWYANRKATGKFPARPHRW